MKAKVTVGQLKIDGIAQLKTKQQLIKQGIIIKDDKDFRNVESNPGYISPEMENSLGKSLKVVNTCSATVTLLSPNKGNWTWPIECVAK